MVDPVHSILPAHDPEARNRWNELCLRCHDQGVFDDLDFAAGLADAQNFPSNVMLSSIGGKDQFGVLLVHRRLGPYREVILPRFCPTTAVLMADDLDVESGKRLFKSAMEFVAGSYHRSALHLTAARVPWAASTTWRHETLYTYRLDLNALSEDVTAGWSAGTRRTFRRNAEEYVVEENSGAGQAAIELCVASYGRSGRRLPISIPRLTRFTDHPPGNVRTRVFLATRKHTSAPEAGLITVEKKNTAYYWIVGSLPGAGMTVLVGKVLPLLRSDGIRIFDFMGANTPSIAEFKRRFGPELHEYLRISTSRSTLLNAMIKLRRRLG